MKLRYRLTLGIGFLFALIVLLGVQSVGYVRHLSMASKEILADNYNSLHYAKDMLQSLDRISQDSASRKALIRSLSLQRENITEVNEREITAALDSKITALTDSVTDSELKLIRDDLYRIMELNMASIHMKSSDTAVSATGCDVVFSDRICTLRLAGHDFPNSFSGYCAAAYRQVETRDHADRQP